MWARLLASQRPLRYAAFSRRSTTWLCSDSYFFHHTRGSSIYYAWRLEHAAPRASTHNPRFKGPPTSHYMDQTGDGLTYMERRALELWDSGDNPQNCTYHTKGAIPFARKGRHLAAVPGAVLRAGSTITCGCGYGVRRGGALVARAVQATGATFFQALLIFQSRLIGEPPGVRPHVDHLHRTA